MARLVEMEWVADRLGHPEIVIVDPRRPMKYLSGHLAGALNVPVYKAFGGDGKLLPPDDLAALLGASGVGGDAIPVLYDSPEGQNAAMLAWIFEYLGRTDVCVMASFYEAWKAGGREVLYRPVAAAPRTFIAHPNPAGRITAAEARGARGLKFVDFRSREEFIGERTVADDQPGHIPGAANIVWRDLAAPPQALLRPRAELERLMADTGLKPGDEVVAYCRSGPRAALGYLALRAAGYAVRLYDGSWAEWSRLGLPAEK